MPNINSYTQPVNAGFAMQTSGGGDSGGGSFVSQPISTQTTYANNTNHFYGAGAAALALANQSVSRSRRIGSRMGK
jgi:hypothetical protein